MNFRNDIQGMRAIAVLAVIIYHVNLSWLPAGFLGVDMFFVISGYIVSRLILKANTQFNWGNFYLGRIKRIIPAYLTLLILITIFASVLFLEQDFKFFYDSLKSALYFSSNQYFSSFGNYFAPSSYELPLLHTWSLALEMQFYFILPLLLVFLPKRFILIILFILSLILLTWSEYRISYRNDSLYFSLFARIPEFFAGVLLAIFIQNKKNINKNIANTMSLLGITILFLSFIFINETHYPGYISLVPSVATILLLSSPDGIINKFLSHKILVWIGGISYSLYLWHWPLLAIIRYYTESYELSLSLLLTYLLVTFICAWLSYRFIEQPFRVIKTKKSISIILVLTVSLIISLPMFKKINQTLSPPTVGKYIKYGGVKNICHGQILDSCLRGETKDNADILVIGDSHAAQLNEFFDEIGKTNNLSFEVITASSCVPINDFDVERISNWAHEACISQIKIVESKLSLQDTLIIAGYWSYQLSSPKFKLALENFLENNHRNFKKIVIMAQLPNFSGNVLRQHRFKNFGLQKSAAMLNDSYNANLQLSELVKKYSNTVLFDVSSNTVFKEAPLYNNQLFYDDDHHINDLGISLYIKEAEEKLIDILKQ